MATLWPSITCEGNSTPVTGDTVTSGNTELGLVINSNTELGLVILMQY